MVLSKKQAEQLRVIRYDIRDAYSMLSDRKTVVSRWYGEGHDEFLQELNEEDKARIERLNSAHEILWAILSAT